MLRCVYEEEHHRRHVQSKNGDSPVARVLLWPSARFDDFASAGLDGKGKGGPYDHRTFCAGGNSLHHQVSVGTIDGPVHSTTAGASPRLDSNFSDCPDDLDMHAWFHQTRVFTLY